MVCKGEEPRRSPKSPAGWVPLCLGLPRSRGMNMLALPPAKPAAFHQLCHVYLTVNVLHSLLPSPRENRNVFFFFLFLVMASNTHVTSSLLGRSPSFEAQQRKNLSRVLRLFFFWLLYYTPWSNPRPIDLHLSFSTCLSISFSLFFFILFFFFLLLSFSCPSCVPSSAGPLFIAKVHPLNLITFPCLLLL